MMMCRAVRCFAVLLFVLLAWPAFAREPLPVITQGQIITALERAADWQLRQPETGDPRLLYGPHGWNQAVFWLGLAELAQRQPEAGYRDRILSFGTRQGWQLGPRPAHADDHLIGQVWLWAAAHGAGPESLSAMRNTLNSLIAQQAESRDHAGTALLQPCTIRLCWCDSLFMSPPTLMGLSRMTGDPRYADLARAEVEQSVTLLYDSDQRLFHRDERFINAKGESGRRLFWSRGNGWVIASLANMLRAMPPDDPSAVRYRRLFRHMADRIKHLQRPDGAWPASLLDSGQPAEASGTGLFVFALAWGINAGVLETDRYRPAVLRGWTALNRLLSADGIPAMVQPIGDRPAPAGPQDRQAYGTGAFLLAGTQLLDMLADNPDRVSEIAVGAPPR